MQGRSVQQAVVDQCQRYIKHIHGISVRSTHQACCLLIQQTMSDSRFIGVVGKEALAAHMVAKIIAVRLNGGMATCAAIATCAT